MSNRWLHIQALLEAVHAVLPEAQLHLEDDWVKLELEYQADLESANQ